MKILIGLAFIVSNIAFAQQIPVPTPYPGPICRTYAQAQAHDKRVVEVCNEKLSALETEKNMSCKLSSRGDNYCWANCDVYNSEFRTAKVRLDVLWNCSNLSKVRVHKTVIKYKR